VVELRSESDRLDALQAKMEEYIANGGYRPGQPIQRLVRPAAVSGEPVLSGFTLELADLWAPLL